MIWYVLFAGLGVLTMVRVGYHVLKVDDFARGIARAEGFFVSGSLPQRNNNPGALTCGGVVCVYPTATAGWTALKRQIRLMISGDSRYYHPDMTFRQIADVYTGGDNPEGWASTVAGQLRVTPEWTLGQFLRA